MPAAVESFVQAFVLNKFIGRFNGKFIWLSLTDKKSSAIYATLGMQLIISVA